MPTRPNQQGETSSAMLVAALEKRMDQYERRIDEKFTDLRCYLDERFRGMESGRVANAEKLKDHEERLRSVDQRVDQIEPVVGVIKAIGISFAGLVIVLIWAILTHTITLVH